MSAGSFGLTKGYEKHFGVVEEEVLMISGDLFIRFWEIFLGVFSGKTNPRRQGKP